MWWMQHQVIRTDYKSYAVVYGCKNWYFGIFHYDQITVLTKSTQATPAVMKEVKTAIDFINYPLDNLKNSGEECGWGADATMDEVFFNDIVGSAPNFSSYP